MRNNTSIKQTFLPAAILILILTATSLVSAQTTEFTYQGRLNDTGGQAAAYDFVFSLCASETASCASPIATFAQSGVAVANNGNFTVKLDFGAAGFDGSDRFLEIAVRRANTGSFVTLAPRRKLTSVPYAIQTLKANDALQLGGTAASQYVLTTDPRLSATNYVQNGTTAQPNVNFNIGGTGTANIFNAATQFNLGGSRVLSNAGTGNLFAGTNAGAANTSAGNFNAFFGSGAGASNTNGTNNSFFGSSAGLSTTIGAGNSFFGNGAGGNVNTGSRNTAVGIFAGAASGAQINSTAVGANAFVTADNSLVLGSISGVNNATADTRVGIGTTAPAFKLQIVDPSNAGLRVQTNTAGGTIASFGGRGDFQIDSTNITGGRLTILENGNVGINAPVPAAKLDILDASNTGLRVRTATPGGTIASFGNTGAFRIDATSATGGRFSVLENGNVGIGNPSPTFKLEVNDAGNTGLRVRTNATGGTVASFASNGAFQIDAPNVAGGRLNVLENGNVGIGDDTPNAKLSITGNGTSSSALEINNGAIKVTNAGIGTATPVFVVERNASTVCSAGDIEEIIVINNPYTNNDPNAIVFITPVYVARSPFSAYANVYYETNALAQCPSFQNKWVIRMGANGSQPILRFNVMVIKR